MKKILFSLVLVVSLVGCASTEQYNSYTAVHQAYAEAESEKYRALAAMARQADPTAKAIAAVMLGQNNQAGSRPQIAAPESFADKLLRWSSVILPTATQMYVARQNANVQITNSNNAAATAASTNAAFVGIASQIQAPGTTYNNSYNQDSTHAPTVVQAPEPVIVQIPAPEVVQVPTIQP